jgi:hypothetical protein
MRGLKYGVLLLALAAGGCSEEPELALPSPEEIASYYAYEGQLEAELNGNVVTVTVSQPTGSWKTSPA